MSHVCSNVLIVFHLRYNSIASNNSTKKLLDVSACTCCTLEVGVEVFCFEDSRHGYAIASEALLLPNFGIVEENVNLACVAEVWSVAHTAEDFQRDASASLRGHELQHLQLCVKDSSHLIIVEIFEIETGVDGEASS